MTPVDEDYMDSTAATMVSRIRLGPNTNDFGEIVAEVVGILSQSDT